MDWDDYEYWGKKIAEWGASYHKSLRDLPVRSQVSPGQVSKSIPAFAPEEPEDVSQIMADFDQFILPGMTHWQHPRFFAYFPSNAAPPSILADFLSATLSSQGILWQMSPAATELETSMMEWMRDAVGLPSEFSGVIQDSASTATLAAVLTMRELVLNWKGNKDGLSGHNRLRIYVSGEAHSSVEKAVWIAGIGSENIVRLPVIGPMRGTDPDALKAAVESDIAAGFTPAGVVGVIGGTGIGACDDLDRMIAVAKEFNLYVHVDAAWAGSAAAAAMPK